MGHRITWLVIRICEVELDAVVVDGDVWRLVVVVDDVIVRQTQVGVDQVLGRVRPLRLLGLLLRRDLEEVEERNGIRMFQIKSRLVAIF